MVFFTNKPIDMLVSKKDIPCRFTAISYNDVFNENFPESIVVDAVGNWGSMNQIISRNRIKCITSPVEFHPGNVIYAFLDRSGIVLKLTL